MYTLKIYLLDCEPDLVIMSLGNECASNIEQAVEHTNDLYNANAIIRKIELFERDNGPIHTIANTDC